MKGLNPGVKFFFLSVVKLYGEERGFTVSSNQITEKLGVSKALATQSLAYLVMAGYLDKEVINKPKGRPSYKYSFTSNFYKLLDGLNIGAMKDRRLSQIDAVLFNTNKTKAGKKSVPLNVVQRLFLSTMLIHSNDQGVVDNLSFADIDKLMGMGRDRIISQLSKLKSLGYMRSTVSGATNGRVFGLGKGAYFLNLRHPSYSDSIEPGTTTLYQAPCNEIGDNTRFRAEAFLLIKKAFQRGPNTTSPIRIGSRQELQSFSQFTVDKACLDALKPLKGAFSDKFVEFLQYKLESYASWCLSNCWEQLSLSDIYSAGKEVEGFADLLQKIVTEISRGSISEDEKGARRLATVFGEIAWLMALNTKHLLLKSLPEDSGKFMNHIIIPANKSQSANDFPRHLAVESFYRAGMLSHYQLIVIEEHALNGSLSVREPEESELDTYYKTRLESGLLSEPRKYPQSTT